MIIKSTTSYPQYVEEDFVVSHRKASLTKKGFKKEVKTLRRKGGSVDVCVDILPLSFTVYTLCLRVKRVVLG